MKEMNNMFPLNAVHSKKKIVISRSLPLMIRLLKAIMENTHLFFLQSEGSRPCCFFFPYFDMVQPCALIKKPEKR